MRIVSLLLWWGGTLLVGFLILRMARGRLLGRFPFFSAYLGGVLLEQVVLLWWLPVTSHAYVMGYWISEFVTAVLSFGIIWEGYTEALAPYPGVCRMARYVLGILLSVVGAKAAAGLWASGLRDLTAAAGEFERDLRVLQALALVALAGLVIRYGIPVGRSVLCLMLGYGLYLSFRVASLNALLDLGLSLRAWINVLVQFAWSGASVIWLVGMWNYSPASVSAPLAGCNYESTSRQTIEALGELRDYMVHSWRSL